MFSNAISLDFFHNNLKGRIHQLDPAEVDDVSQAGKGSYLLVMGKLPADSPSNFFTIPPIGNPYLLDETYIIKDLDSNFEHLAELEIHTGRVPEVFVPSNVMMPRRHQDCPNPSQQMADG